MLKNSQISRRDFLKLLALVPGAITVRPLAKLAQNSGKQQPHIIIIVYDAWSARNTSLYGYPRNTMPNLEKFAQIALVYHRHYAAGNFTVPGTASLLTGVYPWKHRAFALGGKIIAKYQEKQIFNLLENNLNTIGYAQNKYSDLLLYQSGRALQTHFPNNIFNLDRLMAYNQPVLNHDPYISFSSIDKVILSNDKSYMGSLLAGSFFQVINKQIHKNNETKFRNIYIGDLLPELDEQFLMSNIVDGTIQILKNLSNPSLVFLHLFPPHEPFRPKKIFSNYFAKSPETLLFKPYHSTKVPNHNFEELKELNRKYDEYLASWDDETSRLYDFIDQSGLREKSYIFLTSDHGQIFERGEKYHMTPLLNDPIVRVPLIVSYPGLNKREDIHLTTNAVDVLPTIASLAGLSKPEWSDGEILPGLGGISNPSRSVFSLEAKSNAAFSPLSNFSISITKNNKRLLLYQYKTKRNFEFYFMDEDPEEMKNLYSSNPFELKQIKDELLDTVADIAKPN